MSTNQPPQGPPPGPPNPPGPPPQGPPPNQWDASAPQPPESGGRRKGLLIGIGGAVVVALIVGTGIFAWSKLSGGGPQPDEALPSDAIAYARLDLDPSASQKMNAMALLKKFPEFEKATGVNDDDVDLRKEFVDEVLADACDVTYADDFEPWIGERLGIGVLPGDTHPNPVFAVQVSDEDAAADAAKKLSDCAPSGMSSDMTSPTSTNISVSQASAADEESVGTAFVDEYMLVAPTQKLADQYAKDAEQNALADDATYRADMDALEDPGVASVWFDTKKLMKLGEQIGAPSSEMDNLRNSGVDSAATALRVGDDHFELASTASGEAAKGSTSDVAELPESTMVALSLSNGKSHIEKLWPQLEQAMTYGGMESSQMLYELEYQSGLSLPDDLATLLGEQATLAVDSKGLDDMDQAEGLSDFNVGLKLTSDPAELQPVVDKLLDSADRNLGPGASDQIVTEETDDGMVLATNDDYASTLSDGGGNLGDSDTFSNAVPRGDEATNVAYIDFDKITEIDGAGDDVKEIEPLKAFGASTWVDDDRTHASVRLTFD